MTKKKLNIESITNELEGASLFFTKPASSPLVPEPENKMVEKAVNPLEDSPFFEKPASPLPSSEPQVSITEKAPHPIPDLPIPVETTTEVQPEKIKKTKFKKVSPSSNRDTTIPRNHDTTVSRYHDTTTPTIYGVVIEIIRKAVKEFGKEAATHRFTEAEKKEIADLIYTYKNRGIKTSENEITRIAVNFIMEDYKENGENSVLHKILKALNE